MRATWTGSISFGLVSVPIKLYKATESHSVSFNQLHAADNGKIKYQKVCSDCEQVVTQDEICKGHAAEGGYVTVSEQEISQLQGDNDKQIKVLQFFDAAEMPVVAYEGGSYYVIPEKSVAGYALLTAAMQSTDKIALVEYTMRSKTSLATLRLVDDMLVLTSVTWADEIRDPQFDILDKVAGAPLKQPELDVAKMLVESMSKPLDLAEYSDHYTVRLRELLAAKEVGAPTPVSSPADADQGVDDLMAQLQASIAAKAAPAKKTTTRRKRSVA